MPFSIIRNRSTLPQVDAIVNAADSNLHSSGGLCSALFRAAGVAELELACAQVAPVAVGDAAITPAFALPMKYIIHAVGPLYIDGTRGEEELLTSAYTNALNLAAENGCESIAFPLVASGAFGYPVADALRVLSSVARAFLAEHDMNIVLVVWGKESVAVGKKLVIDVEGYIGAHYIAAQANPRSVARRVWAEKDAVAAEKVKTAGAETDVLADAVEKEYAVLKPLAAQSALDDAMGRLDEPFSQALLRLIDQTGKSDAEIYRRANLDRRLFSKIRSNEQYAPSKPTVLAFAIALCLTLAQTKDLLARAGFALSHSRKFDVVIEYFIVNAKYDIFEINEVLFHYDQPLLGA